MTTQTTEICTMHCCLAKDLFDCNKIVVRDMIDVSSIHHLRSQTGNTTVPVESRERTKMPSSYAVC